MSCCNHRWLYQVEAALTEIRDYPSLEVRSDEKAKHNIFPLPPSPPTRIRPWLPDHITDSRSVSDQTPHPAVVPMRAKRTQKAKPCEVSPLAGNDVRAAFGVVLAALTLWHLRLTHVSHVFRFPGCCSCIPRVWGRPPPPCRLAECRNSASDGRFCGPGRLHRRGDPMMSLRRVLQGKG